MLFLARLITRRFLPLEIAFILYRVWKTLPQSSRDHILNTLRSRVNSFATAVGFTPPFPGGPLSSTSERQP